MDKRKYFYCFIIAILLLASFLRFYNIERGDPLGDEADYGYRSYGLLDYESSPTHKTPIEWYDPNPLPIWLRLSFHDAPPLFFLVQHISFSVFGENTFALRFPSAVFGVATVFLTIVLGTLLYSRSVGLLAGVLLAIGVNSIYISRVGMLDSMCIFFIMLTLVFYKKGLENRWYLLAMGISLGLGIMTKYTAIIAGIIVVSHSILFHRSILKVKRLWMGGLLSILIFSPVIIYNTYLFKAYGHFDYALMNMLGPVPDVWQANPGREIGTITERIIKVIPKTFAYGFWAIVLASYLSVIYLFWKVIHEKGKTIRQHGFLLVSILLVLIFLIILGPSPRFVAMIRPLFVLGIAYTFGEFYKQHQRKKEMLIVVMVMIGIGVIFDVNTFFIPDPIGFQYIMYGRVHYRQDNLGYVELDNYFKKELDNKVPLFRKKPKYSFINTIQEHTLTIKNSLGYDSQPTIIVLDPNMEPPAALFVFGKLKTYHGWPIISIQTYLQEHKKRTIPAGTLIYFPLLNHDNFVKVKLANPFSELSYDFERSLQQSHILYEPVKDWSGNDAFRVYKWIEKNYNY